MLTATIRPSILASLLVLVFAAHSQSLAASRLTPLLVAAGSISGRLTAPGLANASGVKVTLLGPDDSSARSSQLTGADGSFVFYDVYPGTYSIEIDQTTLPQKYDVAPTELIQVKAGTRAQTTVVLEPRRSLVGHTYVDVDNNGLFSPGKDTPVEGAQVFVDGRFVVSGADGSFRIDELPAGRMSLVVSWPGQDHTTHVVLDLSKGPVTDRIVNIPLYR